MNHGAKRAKQQGFALSFIQKRLHNSEK